MAKIYEGPDRVAGVKDLDYGIGLKDVGDNSDLLREATEVFRLVATHCAKKGVLADLGQAFWLVDYDPNRMVDRVVVEAPMQGVIARRPAVHIGGTFDARMQAVRRG